MNNFSSSSLIWFLTWIDSLFSFFQPIILNISLFFNLHYVLFSILDLIHINWKCEDALHCWSINHNGWYHSKTFDFR
jgi:hypothetical protein